MLVFKNTRPDEIEEIGNKVYRNFLIEEVSVKDLEGNDTTMFQYHSLVYNLGASDEAMNRDILREQIKIHKEYLEKTSWYVERLNDPSSGKAIPEDVFDKRALARTEINRCELELGL